MSSTERGGLEKGRLRRVVRLCSFCGQAHSSGQCQLVRFSISWQAGEQLGANEFVSFGMGRLRETLEGLNSCPREPLTSFRKHQRSKLVNPLQVVPF
jgi:hypothetical protein